jgi:hypothetical protein
MDKVQKPSNSLSSHLKTETNEVLKTLYSLIFRIPDDGQSAVPLIHHRKDPLDSISTDFVKYTLFSYRSIPRIPVTQDAHEECRLLACYAVWLL